MLKILSELIFPPICLHCEARTEKNSYLFCKGCTGFFELIDPTSRCPYCFAENEGRKACPGCIQKKRWYVQMASAFDYLGAVSSLVKKLKYGRMPYLAKTGAAFMTAQFHSLKWKIPDLIVPVPRRQWFQGANHAHLLAKHLAKSLEVPCQAIIKRKAGDLSQARLTKEQREKLPKSSFYLTRNAKIDDKVILLVDDVITTGTTLRHCAAVLADSFPSKIYALSLARSVG